MTIPEPIFRPAFAITRASHAVLQVTDLQKSRAFYVDTLGFVVTLGYDAPVELAAGGERVRRRLAPASGQDDAGAGSRVRALN